MSDLDATQQPRAVHPPPPPAGPRIARQRVAQPHGWWGMVLFLCSEATIFGSLIGTYYYLDFHVAHWPPIWIEPPKITASAAATGGLILTTPMLWAAVRAARRAARGQAMAWVAFAFCVQAAYLGVQIVLFTNDLNTFTPHGSAYGSIYFTLLAAHHAHVLVGLILDLGILWKLWRHGLDRYWMIGLRGLALYWYVVNALAVLVVVTVLSPSF
ncbi:MAG TPA: cytochrome c oxidase subunit 3 [Solirubrobacteraceae bacterium]|nr:cytochrome c oxidase subunit 3 [Solirubrobacteraceae bacterium]